MSLAAMPMDLEMMKLSQRKTNSTNRWNLENDTHERIYQADTDSRTLKTNSQSLKEEKEAGRAGQESIM